MKTNEIGVVSDEELTVLASVLYSTILQTNFVIDERNIGSMLAPLAEPGFEAAINAQLGLDFMFTNPNKTTFHFAYSICQWNNCFVNYGYAFTLFLRTICRATRII